ncbi:MAG: WYL domain-containing protein [Leptospirales bacterium]|nr:WYL domain-containing protein [Leptospirales bacterium]
MKTREILPRAALARIYFIDRQIASGKYPKAGDLAKEYEVGIATIHRDIDYMRDMLNAPIEYCAKNRGWFYAEKSFRLPARFASADDMLALGMAKSLISLYRDTPLYESAQRLLNDITAPLSPDESADVKKAAWYEKRIVVPPVASAPVHKEIWDVIVDAMKENRLITFEYRGIWDADYKTRLVRPYQLLFDTGVWYIHGYSEERSAIRFFSLSRIKNASLTNESFALPKDFDYRTKNDGSYFGVFLGEKKHYRIAFTSNASIEIQERKWAADQKIELMEDGSGIILDFSSTQYGKILSWVLSFGINAGPIEPPELVNEWKNNIFALYKKAKK